MSYRSPDAPQQETVKKKPSPRVNFPPDQKETAQLYEEQIVNYLKKHPDFLVNHPDLATVLVPPPRRLGAQVVDLQSFIIQRLRSEKDRIKLIQRKLITTSRNNLHSQSKVHNAVLALLEVTSLENLLSTIFDELPLLLALDAIALCFETPKTNRYLCSSDHTNLLYLEPGEVDLWIGANDSVVLMSDTIGDPRLFGPAAGIVRSAALVRINLNNSAPPGLIALGAKRPSMFHPGQAVDLLSFFVRILEHALMTWIEFEP